MHHGIVSNTGIDDAGISMLVPKLTSKHVINTIYQINQGNDIIIGLLQSFNAGRDKIHSSEFTTESGGFSTNHIGAGSNITNRINEIRAFSLN